MKKLNYKKVFTVLCDDLENYLKTNNLKCMVLGISGGIDSTVVAAICSEVSKRSGIPLIGRSLPIKNKNDEFSTSKLVGESFCDEFKVINLQSMYDKVLYECMENLEDQTLIANGNIQARLRMIYLYNLASIHSGIVMSTDNQTEYQLGFWTIHGDVGDYDPIQDLWKTEVYELAQYLLEHWTSLGSYDHDKYKWILTPELKSKISAMHKSMILTPTDGLGISNSDLDQIGANSYNEVDRVLKTLTCKATPENDLEQSKLQTELGSEVVQRKL
jgi:NH3-dependent NAD+ synthetase